MQKLKEDFLYYIWQTKSFKLEDIKTIEGQSIKIINFGSQNINSGPDFQNCKIELDGVIWAGNIEMHVFSSDWEKHKHQYDEAYKNVILHVVYEHDKKIIFNNSQEIPIPTLELKSLVDKIKLNTYSNILESRTWIPCEKLINEKCIDKFSLWRFNLAVERLWTKTIYIDDVYKRVNDDWDAVCYIVLSRYFGATANKIPFEQVSANLDYKIINKNLHSSKSIFALIFGVAGMLRSDFKEDYPKSLYQEWRHLRVKYSLQSINPGSWKFGKMLPSGLPSFRLAQFAQFLSTHDRIFSKITEAKDLSEIMDLFSIPSHEYWEEHYILDRPSQSHRFVITQDLTNRFIINVIIPLLFLYGKKTANENLCDRAISYLEQTSPDKNSQITKWKKLNFKINNALESQALLQLKSNYCQNLACAKCNIGHTILYQTDNKKA